MSALASTPAGHKKQIIGLFPELLGVGGIQEAGRLTVMALSEIALRQDWHIRVLSLNDAAGAQVLRDQATEIPFRGFGRAKLRFVLASLGLARKTSGSSAPVVLAAHPYLAQPAAWMKSVCSGLRTIVMSHGVEVWKPLSHARRRALLKADLVLCPSRDTARKLSEIQGVSPGKIQRLPWPISPYFARLAANPADLPLPRGFPHGKIILTVGRWAASERYKGADELIRAVARLRATIPDLHLVAVGGGDDLPRLRKLASDLGVADDVHFLEMLSRKEIAACYASADLFALPSSGEGFGLVFVEAMAFAKPVVGASCGGTLDIVQHGVNGLLVPPRDTARLAEALERLLCGEPLRTKLGRNGAETVRREYKFDVFCSRLGEILDGATVHGDCVVTERR
ncbi:MAG: glycosyltransferase family 4 protein [Candidatus Acidiferrales bacterium]